MDRLWRMLTGMGETILYHWLLVGFACALLFVVARPFFRSRKIQHVGFDARIFRHEVLFSALTLGASALTIGVLWGALRRSGQMTFADGSAPWFVVLGEFAVYFFAFDLYFYSLHRLMHVGPIFRWVHSTHHRSMTPNPLTAFSFNPIEGMLTGGFLPVFLAVFEVHRESLAVIGVFQPIMSLFVHSGHEFLPRWWYRSGPTGWLQTPLFHDQHHQLVGFNYGGFTTIWDRVLGTVSPGYQEAFEQRPWSPVAVPAGSTLAEPGR